MKQNSNKNTAKIATSILLVINMHIRSTRLLKDDAATASYESEGRLYGRSQGLEQGDNRKIEEAVANTEDNKDEVEDPQKKNKRLKREKMYQKHLSKAKKKACLEAKEVDNDKNASNNKNESDDKETGFSAPAVVASSGHLTPVTTSLDTFAPVAVFLDLLAPDAASPGPLTPSSINLSPASATGTSVAVCSSLFPFPIWFSLFSFLARHTTLISLSPIRVLKSTSLPLEDDY